MSFNSGCLVAALLGVSLASQAATFSPVTASTSAPIAYPSAQNSPAFLIDSVINYDQYLAVGNEGSGAFAGPYTVSFDLGGAYDLSGMRLWNNAGGIGNDGEGINGFELRFLDAGLGLLGTYAGSANDGLASQSFGLAAAGASHVDLVILSNNSLPGARAYVALYEINFDGVAAVPEPGTWALMGLGLGLLAWRVRRTA